MIRLGRIADELKSVTLPNEGAIEYPLGIIGELRGGRPFITESR